MGCKAGSIPETLSRSISKGSGSAEQPVCWGSGRILQWHTIPMNVIAKYHRIVLEKGSWGCWCVRAGHASATRTGTQKQPQGMGWLQNIGSRWRGEFCPAHLQSFLQLWEPTSERCGGAGASPKEVTEMLWGLGLLSSGSRLGQRRVLSLEKTRLQGDFIAPSSAWRGSKRAGDGLGTKGYAFKLSACGFRLDFRKKLFAVSVVRQWIMLPGVGASLSLEIFKTRVDVVMSNLV